MSTPATLVADLDKIFSAHKLTELSARRRGVPLRAVMIAADDLAAVVPLLQKCARYYDIAGYDDKRDTIRRLLAAIEAAQ